jgi:prevent-host-death family protein
MTKSVGVHEAKTHLSRLLEDVEAGEEVVITRRGEEVARLVPVSLKPRRVFGTDRGVWSVPEDFDDPLPPEIQRYFE